MYIKSINQRDIKILLHLIYGGQVDILEAQVSSIHTILDAKKFADVQSVTSCTQNSGDSLEEEILKETEEDSIAKISYKRLSNAIFGQKLGY